MKKDFSHIKEFLYEKERQLSPYAAKSFNSKGRREKEEPCPFRTDFQRDRDRILHSKAFRRLKSKTQVFYAPTNDHLRTRLTHTLEVAQIARTITKILNLNDDLAEAIALGHDLGHTPFGHSGEEALDLVVEGGFKHNKHSVRVAQEIEKLNLTYETVDGILNHTGGISPQTDGIAPQTLEGQVVRICDKLAYLTHDIEDAIIEGIIKKEDLPDEFTVFFGGSKNNMIRRIIEDIYVNSLNQDRIRMSENCVKFLNNLRAWMFKNVYLSDKTKCEEKYIKEIVVNLFNYYKNLQSEQFAIDYVAGMSDEFALKEYEELIKKQYV